MGGMDGYPAVSLPPKNPSSFSSTVRFIGFLKQPESDNKLADRLLELDERDVIWGSTDLNKSDPSDPDSEPDSESESSRVHQHHHHHHPSSGFGLSAVFAEDGGVAIRRPVRSLTGRVGSGPDKIAKSAPVNVPMWHRRRFDGELEEVEEEDDVNGGGDDDDEMVPPHVLVARSHVTTFSVFEGVGRTLKGRDLRRVRNAVFQQTGFLD